MRDIASSPYESKRQHLAGQDERFRDYAEYHRVELNSTISILNENFRWRVSLPFHACRFRSFT